MSAFDLTGRLAVVTGASRGIGFALAEALAGAGADVIGVSASLDPAGSAIGDRVRALGREFTGHRVDFSVREQTVAFARVLAERERPADILVNNAGMIKRAPAADHPADWFDEVLEVDLASGFLLAQAAGRRMLAAGRGRILFTASLLSFQGGVLVPGYAAAKSGVAGLVRALSNEWAGQGVTVNGIAPGYIATDNTQALQDDPDRSRAILERIPAGRWGRAEDLGGAAVFLASDAAQYVTGAIIPVDGGWLGR
ncbi:MAG: SDR family oxidoreductase [Microbacterium sp.]|uniref:SDR family oxidoreductase n=1 Tax=Microbacterium sp. TaxID=51671 RepID=UPI001AC34D7F|nr:SDR family oxidoreductase [Microbacterium sp.]MBN9155141.1 SDR family oxidoreductase [Microbacterium sp.]MBN9187552.1 SDR family oxidoreductase [Microbacterium sp.]